MPGNGGVSVGLPSASSSSRSKYARSLKVEQPFLWCFAREWFTLIKMLPKTEPVAIFFPSCRVSRFFRSYWAYAFVKQFSAAYSKSPSLSCSSPSLHSLKFHAWFFTLIAYAYCMWAQIRQVASRVWSGWTPPPQSSVGSGASLAIYHLHVCWTRRWNTNHPLLDLSKFIIISIPCPFKKDIFCKQIYSGGCNVSY